jgi:SAM-dependent methyltransferase
MKREVLRILCCPNCGHNLTLNEREVFDGEVVEGALTCGECRRGFEISKKVPRLTLNLGDRQKMAKGWGFEWTKKAEGKLEIDTSYGRTQEQEVQNFLRKLGINYDDLRGKTILDAGCGYGWLTQALGKYGARVYGIDIASSIEITYDRCNANNVHVIQADILNPPFKNGSFDYVWSNLAICYLPNPQAAFRNLAKLTKPSGRLFISVPDKADLAFSVRLRDYLRVTHKVPIRVLFGFSWCVALFLYASKTVARRYKTSLRTNAFFAFTVLHPSILTRHTCEEVINWFTSNEFSDVVCMSDAHILYARGQKAA